MSPSDFSFGKIQFPQKQFSAAPALNAFESMMLIWNTEYESGLQGWVKHTTDQMNEEERFRHKLVTNGFYYAIQPVHPDESFEAYLKRLEDTAPSAFRDRLLGGYERILRKYHMTEPDQKLDWANALTSAENYVEFLMKPFGAESTDVQVEMRAYDYVVDPAALKQLVTSHMRWFWKKFMEPEWQRVAPMLEETVRAFNQVDLTQMSRSEILSYVAGQDLSGSKWAEIIESTEKVVFLPNAHIGPYIHTSVMDDTAYLTFGAHLPEGSGLSIPELDRTEIASRMAALADETRLSILQIIARNGEMRTNDLMEEVKLSQPSVSRYLSQLTACGYLTEKRVNSAKVYSLNRERIEKTFKAVTVFLLESK